MNKYLENLNLEPNHVGFERIILILVHKIYTHKIFITIFHHSLKVGLDILNRMKWSERKLKQRASFSNTNDIVNNQFCCVLIFQYFGLTIAKIYCIIICFCFCSRAIQNCSSFMDNFNHF